MSIFPNCQDPGCAYTVSSQLHMALWQIEEADNAAIAKCLIWEQIILEKFPDYTSVPLTSTLEDKIVWWWDED